MLVSVITTIQEPTRCVEQLVAKLFECGGQLVVAGDTKGPTSFNSSAVHWPVEFLDIKDQESAGFAITKDLPTKHYARKNVAYLQAIRNGADCIYETDDDNAPNEHWAERSEVVESARHVTKPGWNNVYRYFSEENIWPRGLPLDEIVKPTPPTESKDVAIRCPIQQGLVNGSPDVDAIWRLVMDKPFNFEDRPSVFLPPGTWCPFNTQSTWWWPIAYPLLYVPSYCSFRMCDIWKSFVAQRCLWAMELGIVFHSAEVIQDRNDHDLQRDFDDEVPGYTQNRRIAEVLSGLSLESDESAVSGNMLRCYQALVDNDIFPNKELPLVEAWLSDVKKSL